MTLYYSIITIYWILFFGLIIYLLWKKDLKAFERTSSYLLFTSIFFYLLIWIPQGLDITDEGYTLTKSWFSVHGLWKDNVDITWMSSVINGLWLSIIGEPSVLWGRIGFAIMISLTSVISFSILRLYFKTAHTFVVVFIITGLYTLRTFMLISYYILPVFLVLLSVYFLVKYLNSGNSILLIGAGFIIAFVGFVKCTFFVTPVIYLFYLRFFQTGEKKALKPVILNSLAGLISGYIFGIIILLLTGSFKIYIKEIAVAIGLIDNPYPTYETSHSLSNLLSYYSENFYRLFLFCIVGINILLIYLVSISNLKTWWWRSLVTILFSYFTYYTAKNGDSELWEYVVMTIGFIFLFLYQFDTKSRKQFDLILLLSVCVFFLSFLGSNNGLVTGFQSGGLLLFLSLSVLICDEIKFDSLSLIKTHSFKYLKYVFFGFILLILIWKKPDDVYRERPRNELKIPFTTIYLKGIFSNLQRVNSVDSLIIVYNDIRKRNDKKELSTLTINSNPMFYFLVKTRYYLQNPWLTSIKGFEEKILTEPEPEIFVFSLQNPRNLSWPRNDSKPCDGIDSLDYNYFMNYVLKNNYISAYRNKMFQLYARPELLYGITQPNILTGNSKILTAQTSEKWEKLRPNCNVSFDDTNSSSVNFEIENTLQGGTAGIYKSVLLPDKIYFVTARVKSDYPAKIILQAGGGRSVISYQLPVNKWMEVKGFLKATGEAFIIYADNMPVNRRLYISDAGVFNTVLK